MMTCPHCQTPQKTRMKTLSMGGSVRVFQNHDGLGGIRCIGSRKQTEVPTTKPVLTDAEQALVDALSNTSPVELERFSGLDRERCQTILSMVGRLSREK